MLKGSLTETLIGIVSDSGKSLEEYRDERLRKYDSLDWHQTFEQRKKSSLHSV